VSEEAPSERELAFTARTKEVLNAMAQSEASASLDATFAQLAASSSGAASPSSRPARFGWPSLTAALAFGAIVAALAAWLISRASPAPLPMAFDGDLAPALPASGPTVSHDEQGRVSSIATLVDGRPDGERVLFRAGRVVRIEHWQDGRLHGLVTDFDGAGRATRIETWHRGALQGPSLDLDVELRPRAQGTPP